MSLPRGEIDRVERTIGIIKEKTGLAAEEIEHRLQEGEVAA